MIKFARGKAPFLVKQQIVELDRSAPSHLHHLDLQTSLRLGHTQSCQGKAPGSHLLPALLVLGMESALSRYITRKGKDIGGRRAIVSFPRICPSPLRAIHYPRRPSLCPQSEIVKTSRRKRYYQSAGRVKCLHRELSFFLGEGMGPMGVVASRLGEKLFVCFILIAETVNDSFLSESQAVGFH
ncbi:hypothetical protein NC653_023051 [Populus alba x Populus x berolinensis]|uniref:Uncharacterized protein n=1 Tax=Populus alba x Populus x berolinensis TaxID=444605 RepID=A0AAD6QCD8_9ROSI|nr:hypothetical protein NC653_023051 [Populus alba x Populus x berolinensis]